MNKASSMMNREIVIKRAVRLLREKYTYEEVRKKLDTAYGIDGISVPTSIFNDILSPLESVVKYLHDNNSMKFSEIARVLGRDQRAIGVTYRSAKKKMTEDLIIAESKYFIPVSVIADRRFSALENIVMYLRAQMSFHQVAVLLKRDDRTIWTIYSRALAKKAKIK